MSNSRLNATKHGCCAKTLILPDECQEDFDQIHDGWMTEFEPDGYQEMRLVEILILNDWHLQRAQWRLWEAEAALCAGPEEELDDDGREIWEARMQHNLELKQRYKTSCERAFYRAWAALQGLRKDMERRQWTLARMEEKKRKLEKELEAIEKKYGVKREPESSEPLPEARRHDAGRQNPRHPKVSTESTEKRYNHLASGLPYGQLSERSGSVASVRPLSDRGI